MRWRRRFRWKGNWRTWKRGERWGGRKSVVPYFDRIFDIRRVEGWPLKKLAVDYPFAVEMRSNFQRLSSSPSECRTSSETSDPIICPGSCLSLFGLLYFLFILQHAFRKYKISFVSTRRRAIEAQSGSSPPVKCLLKIELWYEN